MFMETVNIRTIRKLSNDVVKYVTSGVAARLVSSGNYVYCDDLQEKTPPPRLHTKRRLDATPSPIINAGKVLRIDDPPKLQKRTPRTVTRNKVNIQPDQELNVKSDGEEIIEKERSGRKIRKKSEIPEETMDAIRQAGEISANIIVTPLHSAGDLKTLIDEQRAKRNS
jgi:hypothetical protein